MGDDFRSKFGSFAMFAAILRASSFVSNFAPLIAGLDHSNNKCTRSAVRQRHARVVRLEFGGPGWWEVVFG